MGSLKNVENSCHLFSEADNENRCLIIRQSTTRNALKKKEHDDELLDVEVVESKGILKEQVESVSRIFVELLKMKEE